MNFRFSIFGFRLLATAFVRRGSKVSWLLGALLAGKLAAQGDSSLTESKIENAAAHETASQQETVRALTESLAESNAEAEVFRRKYSDLQLRMEALGLESADKDRAKLEQRLLTAVSDLQLLKKEQGQYRDQLLRLTEAILRVLKTSTSNDGKARMELETQLRKTNELALKSSSESAGEQSSLMDGSVISVKEEWSLVVGNLGEKQGVKMGMPLRVLRGDRQVATLRVVDVRQNICGAVIQEMGSVKEKIKVGDRLQADARQDVTLK